jgi:hypothetical protein
MRTCLIRRGEEETGAGNHAPAHGAHPIAQNFAQIPA